MMNLPVLFILLILLFLIECFYFIVAEKFNIIDKPNNRSSHTELTLRGGGIIFAISLVLYPLHFGLTYKYFLIGLVVIACISFIDDIKPVSNKLRILIHLVGVSLMFLQLDLFNLPFYWIILTLIFVIGSINAVNFMDGINGMTGAYSLITLCSLLFINIYVSEFVTSSILITSITSVLVFNFFNFRKKAKCFAGDVGSVSIAFIILFFLLQLVIKTGNFGYLLLLIVYGQDSVTTILFRVIRGENIFDAHRNHLYQYLANEKKMPHLTVSLLYAVVQLAINLMIIFFLPSSFYVLCLILVFSTIIFVGIRFSLEGSSKLLGH